MTSDAQPRQQRQVRTDHQVDAWFARQFGVQAAPQADASRRWAEDAQRRVDRRYDPDRGAAR